MRVDVWALDDVFDLGLSAVLDAFQTANEVNAMSNLRVAPFDVRIVGMRRSVRTAQGFRVTTAPPASRACDCEVIPAIGHKMPDALARALGRSDVCDAARALRESAARRHMLAAACIGTFVLAESGLLDGERATTTWWLAAMFRHRYPQVQLDETQMLVGSHRFVTAGAALSHMDLALALIRRVSPQLASLTARYLIADSRAVQSAYALTDHLVHDDPVMHAFERWARRNLTSGFSLPRAAKAIGASERTLARRTQLVVGKSPLAYFQSVRVERAVHLLKTTTKSVDEIAEAVGYADGATLRALLRRQLGTGVKSLRKD